MKEKEHVKVVLKDNSYEQWIFKLPKPREKKTQEDAPRHPEVRTLVGLLYLRGLSEKLTVLKVHGISTFHKPFNMVKSTLCSPRDKSPDSVNQGKILVVNELENYCLMENYYFIDEYSNELFIVIYSLFEDHFHDF